MVLGREAQRDLTADSKSWHEEQTLADYRDSPYDYSESDTWARRKRRGQTPERKEKRLDDASDSFWHTRGLGGQMDSELEERATPGVSAILPTRVRHHIGESRHAGHPEVPRVAHPSSPDDRVASRAPKPRHEKDVVPRAFATPEDAASGRTRANIPRPNNDQPIPPASNREVERTRITTEPSDKELRDRWWRERADSVEVTLKKPYAKRSVHDTISGLTATIVIDSQAQSSFMVHRIAVFLEAGIDSPCDEKYEGASKEPLDVMGLLALEVSWDFNGRKIIETVTFKVVKELTLPIIMSVERAKYLGLDKVAKPVVRALVSKKVAPIREVPSASLPPTSNNDKKQNEQNEQQTSEENKQRDDAWKAQKKASRHS